MENAGEIWERNYRRRKLAIMGLVVVMAGLAPVVIKVAGNESVLFPDATFGPGWDVSLPVRILVAALFFGCLAAGARWNWLSSDEVRRSHVLSFWAATGVSVSLTFFGYMLFGEDIPEPLRLPLAFMIPIGMGLLFSIARWFREGFVW
jgi:hypothetical protein